MPAVHITHNLTEIAAGLERLKRDIPVAGEKWLLIAAGDLAKAGDAIVREHTPEDDLGPERTRMPGAPSYEHLRDSTVHIAESIGALTAVAEIDQTKLVPMTADGKVTDLYPLWKLLSDGHDAPKNPILPVNKKALWWIELGWGNTREMSLGGVAAPNPYVEESVAEWEGIVPDHLSWIGGKVYSEAWEVMP